MFCSKCGEILDDHAKFCTACGAKVERHATAVNSRAQFEHHQPVSRMTFVQAIASFFRNYVNFEGRAGRAEFWWVALFLMLLESVVTSSAPSWLLGYSFRVSEYLTFTIQVWELAIVLPRLTLAVRRLHDVGKRGTYLLWLFVPVAGQIMVLLQFLKKSQPGRNEFGEDPHYCC